MEAYFTCGSEIIEEHGANIRTITIRGAIVRWGAKYKETPDALVVAHDTNQGEIDAALLVAGTTQKTLEEYEILLPSYND